MRILMFNYEFPPVGGGASAASFYMARELTRLGHSVDVITCRSKGQAETEIIEAMRVYRVTSIRRSIHDAGPGAVLSYVFFARGVLKRLLKNGSYDHAHFYFALPTGLLSFAWRAMSGAPYLVSLRGSDVPNYDPNARGLNLLHRLLKPITRVILRRSSSVVANSASLRQLALASFPDQRIITITNGVCPADFSPADEPRDDSRPITALCVARLIPRKNISAVLSAVAMSRPADLRLVIVGTGPAQRALARQARRLGIDDRVEFAGYRSEKDLVACYRNADFLVHPTLTESFSMTLLEAMSCGLPIIASEIGGIPELVEHDVNGLLIAPHDIRALANAIERMAESRELRLRFATQNRAKVLEGFTWQHIAKQYEQLYNTTGKAAAQNCAS